MASEVTVWDSTPVQGFQLNMLVLGSLLIGGALISGITHRSFLSLTALYVLAGFALGAGGFGVLDFSAHDHFIEDLAVVALTVILFRDGLEVEAEMLQREWRVPLRKLILANERIEQLSWMVCIETLAGRHATRRCYSRTGMPTPDSRKSWSLRLAQRFNLKGATRNHNGRR